MSHEGTTGMVAEAVTTEVQAMVQVLATEANTPTAADAQLGMAGVGSDGDAVAATETIAAEAEVPISGTREEADVSQNTAAAEVEAKTAEVAGGVTKAQVKVGKAEKALASTSPAKTKRRKTKSIKRLPAPETAAKVRKTAAVAAKKVVKTKVKSSKAKPHISAVPKRKAPASKSPASRKTIGAKQQDVKAAAQTGHKADLRKFTVPEVWRSIVKKNERQGGERYDVLVCQHAVLANDNTYRRARVCPECRLAVQKYADDVAASRAPKVRRQRKG